MTTKSKNETIDIKDVVTSAEELLGLIGIKAKVDVSFKEDAGFLVNIDAGDEAGLLIGNRGRTLQSLEHILSMMVNKGKNSWTRVSVDVASWKEKEEERLVALAKQTAERARVSGEAQNLYNLNPQQRRLVHMALSEEKDVKTESYGEGKDRYLVVTSK